MPNWCANGVTVTHSDPAKIAALAEAMREGRFLDHIVPVPLCLKETVAGSFGDPEKQAALERSQQENLNNHNYKDWYDFCVNEWGTKWDVNCEGTIDISPDGLTVTASFDSAWAPPCRVYEAMVEEGYEVTAYYYEPGMCFVGKWEDGEDGCYEYGGYDSNTVRDAIGAELDDYFCISENMAEWEEENNEEEQQ
jgi:hypothetical protein